MATVSSLPGAPGATCYDVVIVGGAMMGASVAWFLSDNPDFQGSILVVERDPGYSRCSTTLSHSCMRQQFSQPINVEISQFAADFVTHFRDHMGGDPRIPQLDIQSFGYMYLAGDETAEAALRQSHAVQARAGAATRLLEPADLAREYPFYNLSDIRLGSINTRNEGYWDSGTVFDWWRRAARARGVEFIANEVVAITLSPDRGRVDSVTLKTGQMISCGHVVNAAGTRASAVAGMVGVSVPVEARKRLSWVFTAQDLLPRALPLTIDPSGVHMRQDGPKTYLAGAYSHPDLAVDVDDFTMDHALWQEYVWPTIAHRIPQFEAIRVVTEWVGHYAYNTFDQNAIVGPHPEIGNFLFLNGFSGHGLQQSPAMGRGVAELIAYGRYRSIDLGQFAFERIARGARFREQAVI